jgi:hypothetical protein
VGVLVAGVLGVLGMVVLAGLLRSPASLPGAPGSAPAPPAAPATGAPHAAEVRDALALLHTWDARRAAAYATGSGRRLRDLYVPGSAAGAADLRLLGDYRSRALRVPGLRTQVLELAVLQRRPDRWTLRVTDRVQGGVAVHAGRRLALPRDAASTRVLTMVQGGDDRWRVARVQDAQPSAERGLG